MRHAHEYHYWMRRLVKEGVPHPYKMWIYKLLTDNGYNVKIDWDNPRGEIDAYVHKDAWIADCPNCHNAMIVDAYEPVFWCNECHNADNDQLPYTVNFPHRAEVETLMALRANPKTRNWYPDESVEDLIEEQIEHGEYEYGVHS